MGSALAAATNMRNKAEGTC